jgi:heme-degrading monooxygenase HmoA
MATQRRDVRALPFGKLLGTGSGETFAARDADIRQYALLTAWSSPAAAGVFDLGPIVGAWNRIATQRRFELEPITSRGTWSGKTPFGPERNPPETPAGPVAAITHARIRLGRIGAFTRAVRPVVAELGTASTYRLGIGEAPVGIQGTFSIWPDERSMLTFAHGAAHREAVRRRAEEHWYAEEIFARFTVVSDAQSPRRAGAETEPPTVQ